MYLADTPTRSVYEIDYTENGKLTNRRNIYTQPPNLPGGPDGAQTDSEGFVWVVERRAGRVVRVDPTDGRVDVVVITPGSPSRMGEEQEEFLKVGFLFSKQQHISQFYSNISLIYMQTTLGHEQESDVCCHTR